MRVLVRMESVRAWARRGVALVALLSMGACLSPPPWVQPLPESAQPVIAGGTSRSGESAGRVVRVVPGVRGATLAPAPLPDPGAAGAHSTAPVRPALPRGAIPGRKNHPDEFVRAMSGGCACSGTLDMTGCKCLHCGQEAGAVCYCDQGPPQCLCGLDMAGCRCVHCAGREGQGKCPCDHSEKKRELDERRRRAGD